MWNILNIKSENKQKSKEEENRKKKNSKLGNSDECEYSLSNLFFKFFFDIHTIGTHT